MVSVDWKKNKGGSSNEGAARMMHATRHDGKSVKYNNHHVQPELSHLNYTVGGQPDEKRTGQQEIKRLRNRVTELDKQHPPKRVRKDRVTTVSFEVKTPENLPEPLEKQYFELIHAEIAKLCGGVDNVTLGYVHKDEIHEYMDATTGEMRTSRPHLHMQGIVWTDSHGVNGKHFMTRNAMQDLNRAIDERCKQELGIDFLNTKEYSQPGKEWLPVESLKLASAKALNEKIEVLQADKEGLEFELTQATNEKLKLNNQLEEARNKLKRNEELLTNAAHQANQELARASRAENRAEKAEKEVKEAQDELEKIREDIMNTATLKDVFDTARDQGSTAQEASNKAYTFTKLREDIKRLTDENRQLKSRLDILVDGAKSLIERATTNTLTSGKTVLQWFKNTFSEKQKQNFEKMEKTLDEIVQEKAQKQQKRQQEQQKHQSDFGKPKTQQKRDIDDTLDHFR